MLSCEWGSDGRVLQALRGRARALPPNGAPKSAGRFPDSQPITASRHTPWNNSSSHSRPVRTAPAVTRPPCSGQAAARQRSGRTCRIRRRPAAGRAVKPSDSPGAPGSRRSVRSPQWIRDRSTGASGMKREDCPLAVRWQHRPRLLPPVGWRQPTAPLRPRTIEKLRPRTIEKRQWARY